MKIIATILVTAVISATITFFISSTGEKVERQERQDTKTDQSNQQIAELQKQLREAEAEAGKVTIKHTEVIVPGASTSSPEEVLAYLSKLELTDSRGRDSDEHRVLIRQVIRQFEEITSMGPEALSAIERFLDEGYDMVLYENTSQITTRNWE